MNQKLAETLAGWRQNRDEDSPSIAALDTAERLLERLSYDPVCISPFSDGLLIELNATTDIEIQGDGSATIDVWDDERLGAPLILELTAEVPA